MIDTDALQNISNENNGRAIDNMENLSTVREGNIPARVLSFNLKDILIKISTKSDFLSTKEELNL